MENIFWKGYSNDERHPALDKIQTVVSKYGFIVDFKLFSDISLSITIEIEEFKIEKLHDELSKIIGIAKSKYPNSSSENERTVYLHITFAGGTGNLKNEVPAVPG